MAFLSGYTTRYKIDIANNVGSNLTNHQVPLAFNHSALVIMGSSQATGSDIVVTSSDGSTLLPYWIETRTINGSPCNVWTKLPSLGSAGSTTVYLYFDGVTQTGSSNGANTFEWFDDFETHNVQTINGSKGWNVTTGNVFVASNQSATVGSTKNGKQSMVFWSTSGNPDVNNGSGILSNLGSDKGFTLNYYAMVGTNNTATALDFYTEKGTTNFGHLVGMGATAGGMNGSIYIYDGAYTAIQPTIVNKWYFFQQRFNGTSGSIELWIDNVYKITKKPYSATTYSRIRPLAVANSGSSFIDSLFVTKFIGSDPNTTLTFEEEANLYGPVVGSYVGDGTSDKLINFGSDTGALMVFVRGDQTFGSAGGIVAMANLVGSSWSIGEAGNAEPFFVTGMGTNAFIVGSNENVNANGSTYYYTIVPKNSQMVTLGSYIGNNSANRAIPVGSDIACLILARKNDGIQLLQFAGVGSQPMFLGANLPKYGSDILHISGGSFIVQNHALVNHSFGSYYWAAFHIGSFIRIGSYFGDDTNNREITTEELNFKTAFIKPHNPIIHSDLLNGLLAYYKFDGNGSSMTGSYHLVVNGAPSTSVAGKFNTSTGMSSGNNWDTTKYGWSGSQFGWSGWIKTTGTDGFIYIERNTGTNDWAWFLYLTTTGSIQFSTVTSGQINLTAGPVNNAQWHHIAATYDGGSMYLSLNGLVGSTAQTGNLRTFSGGEQCYGFNSNSPTNTPYVGSLDEVGLWTRALSVQDMQNLYNQGRGVFYPLVVEKYNLYNGLLAYYSFNTQGSAVDLIGSDIFTSHTISGSDVGKANGSCVILNGTATQINFGSSLHTIAKTINLWVKKAASGGDATQMIWSASGSPTTSAKIQCDTSGSNLLLRFATTRGEKEFSTGYHLPIETWTMVTAVHDDINNKIRCYINGSVLSGSGLTDIAIHSVYIGGESKIGGWYAHTNNDFAGSLSAFGFWDRTLEESEVQMLYNNGSGMPFPFYQSGLNYSSWRNLSMTGSKSASSQGKIMLEGNLITNMGSTSFTVGSDFNA